MPLTVFNLNESAYQGALAGLHRTIDAIRPEEFSTSYRHLVQHDFSSKDLETYFRSNGTREGTAEGKEHCDAAESLLTKINIICDAMDTDGNNVLPVNFSAVGSILLEFMNALSDHMGWAKIIEDIVRNNVDARHQIAKPHLILKRTALSHIWGRLLSRIDQDCIEQIIPEFDVDKVSAFAESFFHKVEKRRYIFFVEDEEVFTLNH